jgi:hypothetical protein
MPENAYSIPKKSKGDAAHALVKAGYLLRRLLEGPVPNYFSF